MKRKKYVVVGVGGRARVYYESLVRDYKDICELAAFCDINRTRCEYANRVIKEEFGAEPVPIYNIDEFEKMLAEQKPDKVIVTSIDRTHHRYIIKAMELGYDVITEKPMTTDAKKAQEIVDTIEKTGRNLCVTFNYRYAPHSSKVRELLMQNTIGDITQVHFEWFLNTSHGADYFRRWHRDKRNSGGLLVHKSTHHFDLINFWLDSAPETVFAFGDLKFYGRENAEKRGITKFYSRAYGSENAKGDPFALVMEGNENLEGMYLNAEHEDGYFRDQSVFGDGISIEDTMNVLVRYENGVQMSYSLNAYSPVEGFRACLTGTKGRIEVDVLDAVYINGEGKSENEGVSIGKRIKVLPMFGSAYDVPVEEVTGGHGGADPQLMEDIFAPKGNDPLKRISSHIDGIKSIMVGIAANESMKTGMPVKIRDLIKY